MSKKIVSLLMLVIMLSSVLAGCATATATAPAAQATATTAAPAADPTATTAAPAADPTATTAAVVEPTATTEAAAPSGEVVMLDYYWIGNSDTDVRAAVEKNINDYIGPKIGANVTFHIIGWNDWAGKAVTALQSGEKVDIVFTADWRDYMQEASQGLLTPLNDPKGPNGNLLETYGQDILKTLNPAFITGTQIDGVNYAVPTNKELTVPMGFLYNLTAAEEIGLTAEEAAKIKTMADWEPWAAKFKEKHPDQYPYLAETWWGFEPWLPSLSSAVPGNVLNMKMAPDANGKFDETIYSVWETPENQEFVKLMRSWYEKKYIHPDAGLTTFDVAPDFNAGKFLFRTQPLKGNNIKAQEMVNASGNADLKLGEIYGQPKINVTHHAGGSMLAIGATSEYPVQAMKLINLMHSDPKLINMMLYGVEGDMWKVETDGRVNIINSSWYGAHAGAWTIGNTQLQLVSNKEDPKKNGMLIEYSNDAIAHPTLGFRFRTEPVAAELTAIQAVVDGMNKALFTGSVDPAVELPKYVQALKDAGMEKVKAELQKQYDEWKAKK